MAELNERQKRFAEAYLETGVAAEAARRAGYPAKSATSKGSQLLANVNVRAYVDERLKKGHAERVAKADEVLEYLTKVMRREETETVVVTLKSRKSYYDKVGKKVVDEKETPQLVEIPSKLMDANKAAELLGRRYQLFDGSGAESKPNGIMSAILGAVKKHSV